MNAKVGRALLGVVIGWVVGVAIGTGTGNWGAGVGIGTGLAIVLGGGAALMDTSSV